MTMEVELCFSTVEYIGEGLHGQGDIKAEC